MVPQLRHMPHSSPPPPPPHPSTRPRQDDPLFWLRSDDRDDPAVLAHLALENEATDAALAPLAAASEALYAELKSRLQVGGGGQRAGGGGGGAG
jgi:protease II